MMNLTKKVMSVYDGRVASAKTAGDFAAIDSIPFFVHFILGTVYVAFGIEGRDGSWFDNGHFFFIIFCLPLWLWHYGKADIRFWDPRVYLAGGYSEKINIEKLRAMHTTYGARGWVKGNLFLVYFSIGLMLIFITLDIWGW